MTQENKENKEMNYFLIIMQMLPSIIGVVKSVETAFPVSGSGPAKLNMVLDVVNVAATTSPDITKSIGDHDLNGTVTAIVNATVKGMNIINEATSTTPTK